LSGQFTNPDGKGKTAVDTKLPVDAMQVKLDGSFSDIEFTRYRFVGKTFRSENRNVSFALAQYV